MSAEIVDTASEAWEGQRAVLRARAQELARPDVTDDNGERLDLVEFCFSDGHYAVEARFVHEAYPLRGLTPLPGTPSWICGAVNVRSQVLTAVDVRQWLGLPPYEFRPGGQVLILGNSEWHFAMPVDDLVGAVQLPLEILQSGDLSTSHGPGAFVRGVSADRLTLLDAARIFSDERMSGTHGATGD